MVEGEDTLQEEIKEWLKRNKINNVEAIKLEKMMLGRIGLPMFHCIRKGIEGQTKELLDKLEAELK